AALAAVCVILLLHALARDSVLILQPPPCFQLHVVVLSCPPGSKHGHSSLRYANAQRIVRSSPYPASLIPCRNETPPRAKWKGLTMLEARLVDSHTQALKVTLESTSEKVCGLVVFEDDALVDWEVLSRVTGELARLREHWDMISLHDFDYFDRGLSRFYYTDRAVRFGCLHRILAGKSFSVGMIYSREAARRILRATEGTWDRQYDAMLGRLNGLPLDRLRHMSGVALDPLVPSTFGPWVRILRWGCQPPVIRHGLFSSTIGHDKPGRHHNKSRNQGMLELSTIHRPKTKRHSENRAA
ncbi:MAG: hypothetical protein SGPRY_006878, partial [Prymnesium sp.]